MQLVTTLDGSHTIYRPDIDEHYHSVYGAIQESMHVFIKPGIQEIDKNSIKILEVGFGTGLNVFLSIIEAYKENKSIIIDSVEKYPVDLSLAMKLNYPGFMPGEYRDIFRMIHSSAWNVPVQTGNCTLTKICADILTHPTNKTYDIIYYDAFSPEKEPFLWTPEIYRKMYNALNSGGYLLTYCVKGEVRRGLNEAGFIVEKKPGPPGKKNVLKATKNTYFTGSIPVY